ncbi:MAG: flagellar export chaperone FlgN [Deltaproteobacteria bacterium]|nr:MAG: flagellar export chaperone FlgN [Deltaproteobacteria bacterium]
MLLEDLKKVLSLLTADLQGLITCLQDEKEAVIQYDLKKLKNTYQSKYRQLQKIDETEKSRKEITRQLTLEAGLALQLTVEELLSRAYPGEYSELKEEIRDQMSCVRSLSQAAQEFNELQRQFLMYSLQDVQSSLYLLESLQGNEKFQGYNQQGEREGASVTDRPSAVDSSI